MSATCSPTTWAFMEQHSGAQRVGEWVERVLRAFVARRVPYQQASLDGRGAEDLAREGQRERAFLSAMMAAAEHAQILTDEGEADPPDGAIWREALSILLPYAVALPVPLVLPLQRGGISFEWHLHGMNIELRFRRVGDVYVLIEDAWSELSDSRGRERGQERMERGLAVLARRAFLSERGQVATAAV